MMKIKKRLYWIPAFCWMLVIFYLSHQPADESSQLSSGITTILISMIEFIFPLDDLHFFHFLVRKAAHFFAYFVLGILVFYALQQSLRKVNWNQAVTAFFISVLYAISDEFHQLFIPGRSCEMRDILIDSFGAFFGISLYYLYLYLSTKKKV